MKSTILIAAVLAVLATGTVVGDDAAQPAATGATITGTLKSVWLRKYPMVVYLEKVAGDFPPPRKQPVLDQKNKMFVPHAMAILKGTTIRYVNHDDVKHNVYFTEPDGTTLNLGTGTADWSRQHTMDKVGVYAHRCNVHDEMSAYIVSMQNPYFTLIDKGAKKKTAEFTIKGVPPGTYTLRVWCEKFYDKKDHKFNRAWKVTVRDGEQTTIDVKP